MRSTATALLLAVAPVLAFSAEVQLGYGAPETTLVKARRALALEYCPDNTCEVFRSSRATTAVLKDFGLLYLYGVSDYVYLEEFQAQDLTVLVGELATRYGAKCERPKPKSFAACVAAHVAKKHAISVRFVRYDEGRRHESEVEWRGNAI